MKLGFNTQIFETHSNIKFHGNLSSGSRVVPWGRTVGQTDTTKITIAFRNFVKVPKNYMGSCPRSLQSSFRSLV